MNTKPILAITMGDPAGIGPEIIIKALSLKETYDKCAPIVTGDAAGRLRPSLHRHADFQARRGCRPMRRCGI